MNIGMIGLGKLGMDAAEVFATKNTVYGYDIYPRESDTVNVCDTVEDCVNKSDWIFIAVETPIVKSTMVVCLVHTLSQRILITMLLRLYLNKLTNTQLLIRTLY